MSCRRSRSGEQELGCAARAADGRVDHPEDAPAVVGECRARLTNRGAEQKWVVRRTRPAQLELRLDERDRLRVRGKLNLLELRYGLDEREVGDVDRDDVDRFGDHCERQVAEVRALEVHHSRIATERTEQLAVSGVDGVDTEGSGPEEDLREASGGRADIERNDAANLDAEGIERRLELAPTAQRSLPANSDRSARAHEGIRIRSHEPVDDDLTRADPRLGIVEVGMRPRKLVHESAQTPSGLAQRCLLSDA